MMLNEEKTIRKSLEVARVVALEFGGTPLVVRTESNTTRPVDELLNKLLPIIFTAVEKKVASCLPCASEQTCIFHACLPISHWTSKLRLSNIVYVGGDVEASTTASMGRRQNRGRNCPDPGKSF